MNYQYPWNMCLFMKDNTYGSCTSGAPPHSLRLVRQRLNQTFGEQWTGCGGPVNWLARYRDLNPLNFCLWGHLKTLVYSALINDLPVNGYRIPVSSFVWLQEFGTQRVSLCDEELKIVLKWIGTTRIICCRDYTNIAHTRALVSEQLTATVLLISVIYTLKSLTLLLNTLYILYNSKVLHNTG
jgi:hypothetical protein